MKIEDKLYNCGIVRQDLFCGLSKSLECLMNDIEQFKVKVNFAENSQINERWLFSASDMENFEDKIQNIRRELDKIHELSVTIEILKKVKEGEYK